MIFEKLIIKVEKVNLGDFKEEIKVFFNFSEISLIFFGVKMGEYGFDVLEDDVILSLNLFFDISFDNYLLENV